VCLLIVCSITGCKNKLHKSGEGLNLLVITLDTTRADRLGAYGCTEAKTPHLDRLARQGIKFENCYSPVPLTFPAHCSLFTGEYPLAHQCRNNASFFLSEDRLTLAEVMKEKGFFTYADIASFVLLAKFGLNQGFDLYDDSLRINQAINELGSEITADRVFAKFAKWFKQRNKEKPFFAWVHFFDPHYPYAPPKEYLDKFEDEFLGPYDGEVAYMDNYIGRIVEELESAGILDNTLIVAVGDHGEDLGEHAEHGHGIFCYDVGLKVPLLFFNKKLFPKGTEVKSRVNVIDIMPTILDLYGLKIHAGVQGESLVDLMAGNEYREQRTFYFESLYGQLEYNWAPLTGIIADKYKFISLPEPELYDLEADKNEKENLLLKKNRLARDMDKELLKLITKYSRLGIDSRRHLSDEDTKHLRSLGYVSSFSGKYGKNMDPKKGITVKNKFIVIENDIKSGKIEEAEAKLQKMAAETPEIKIPKYYELMRTICDEKGDQAGLLNILNEAVEKFPGNMQVKMNLVSYYFFRSGNLDEAEKICLGIIKERPEYTLAHIFMARIEEGKNNIGKALEYYKNAVAIEPLNVSLKLSYCEALKNNRDISQAAQICDELLKDESVSKNPGIKSQIGIILTEIFKDDLALQVLSEALREDSALAGAWNYLGIIHWRKKDYPESLKAYAKSIELDPKVAITYNNLGALYLSIFLRNRDKESNKLALNAFDKSLEIDPELISALNGRGAAFQFDRKFRQAIKDWKKVIEIQPDFLDAYFNIGVTYLQLGSKMEAGKYLNILKDRFYNRMKIKDRNRLDNLLREVVK
jgi:arylsulfatase A-like enzyme/cytochrome c-type biogenesis protein CcmH/NrfG